jgi:putative endonuclease
MPYGTLYVGMTSTLFARIRQHKAGAFEGFTKRHGLSKLVYREFHTYAEPAILREKVLKRWRRDWKIALIENENPQWQDIAALWDHPEFREDWDGITAPKN